MLNKSKLIKTEDHFDYIIDDTGVRLESIDGLCRLITFYLPMNIEWVVLYNQSNFYMIRVFMRSVFLIFFFVYAEPRKEKVKWLYMWQTIIFFIFLKAFLSGILSNNFSVVILGLFKLFWIFITTYIIYKRS